MIQNSEQLSRIIPAISKDFEFRRIKPFIDQSFADLVRLCGQTLADSFEVGNESLLSTYAVGYVANSAMLRFAPHSIIHLDGLAKVFKGDNGAAPAQWQVDGIIQGYVHSMLMNLEMLIRELVLNEPSGWNPPASWNANRCLVSDADILSRFVRFPQIYTAFHTIKPLIAAIQSERLALLDDIDQLLVKVKTDPYYPRLIKIQGFLINAAIADGLMKNLLIATPTGIIAAEFAPSEAKYGTLSDSKFLAIVQKYESEATRLFSEISPTSNSTSTNASYSRDNSGKKTFVA